VAQITIQLKKVKKLTVQAFFPSALCPKAFCLLALVVDVCTHRCSSFNGTQSD
jgi:hypothetical protein